MLHDEELSAFVQKSLLASHGDEIDLIRPVVTAFHATSFQQSSGREGLQSAKSHRGGDSARQNPLPSVRRLDRMVGCCSLQRAACFYCPCLEDFGERKIRRQRPVGYPEGEREDAKQRRWIARTEGFEHAALATL